MTGLPSPQPQPQPDPLCLPPAEDPFALRESAWVDLRRYNQSQFDRGRPLWLIQLWWIVQAIAFPLIPQSINAPRRVLLRIFGARIGKGVRIRPSARFLYPWKIQIGDYTWIGDDVVFYSLDSITVGKHCVISQKTYLCTGTHDPRSSTFALATGAIVIGNGVWIAADCFVAPNVVIGSNAVIGLRSLVLHSMSAGYMCWGVPCYPRSPRQIRD